MDSYHETEAAFLILMLPSFTGIQTPTIADDKFSTQPPVSHCTHVPMSNKSTKLNDAGWFREVRLTIQYEEYVVFVQPVSGELSQTMSLMQHGRSIYESERP